MQLAGASDPDERENLTEALLVCGFLYPNLRDDIPLRLPYAVGPQTDLDRVWEGSVKVCE